MSAAAAPGRTPPPGAAVTVAAPAKVNLALLVGPRRPDGYHEIASLLVPLTLADLVTVEHTPGLAREVRCEVAPGEDNLVARLLRELEARLGRPFPVRVTVSKRVPAGAGLGGGSSDAAAALRAVERLFALRLTPRQRHAVAAAVGSDVPFFLWPGPQLAGGRGQVLRPVRLPPLHLVVALPPVSLATATVYGWHDEDRRPDLAGFAARTRGLAAAVARARRPADVAALVANDLEASVVARVPAVGELLARLRGLGSLAAAMTGSGAAVFGLFADAAAAERARAALAPARAWVASDLQPR